MHIVPVIDLKGGVVVHARRGERQRYAPLETPLADGAAPADVVDGLLAHGAFSALYVADLDAIAGGTPHTGTLLALAARHPHLMLWLDAGFSTPAACSAFLDVANVAFVLASESLTSLADYQSLAAALPRDRVLLSLDRDHAGRRGCAALFDAVAAWPQRVLHMNLTRVGSGEGPDWDGLEALREQAGGRSVYAAGGVRDDADLARLAARGIAGALVATALHAGRITPPAR